MIGHLSGTLLDCGPGRAVVQAAGVGYQVEIPLGVYYALAEQVGSSVNLHIHTRVREDALTLYGFVERDDANVKGRAGYSERRISGFDLGNRPDRQ